MFPVSKKGILIHRKDPRGPDLIASSFCSMGGGLAYSFFTFTTKTPPQSTEAAHELKIHIPDESQRKS